MSDRLRPVAWERLTCRGAGGTLCPLSFHGNTLTRASSPRAHSGVLHTPYLSDILWMASYQTVKQCFKIQLKSVDTEAPHSAVSLCFRGILPKNKRRRDPSQRNTDVKTIKVCVVTEASGSVNASWLKTTWEQQSKWLGLILFVVTQNPINHCLQKIPCKVQSIKFLHQASICFEHSMRTGESAESPPHNTLQLKIQTALPWLRAERR